MGVFQKKPKRIPYEVREDIRRLDQRIAQIEFLQKQDISTIEQLQEFRHPLEEKNGTVAIGTPATVSQPARM